jgi:hypothetical protein
VQHADLDRAFQEPIEDPDGVDARRAAVGLSTLAEYAEHMRRSYPQ